MHAPSHQKGPSLSPVIPRMNIDDRSLRYSSYTRCSSLSRTSSVRESRATTEERSTSRASTLARNASFTERSLNYGGHLRRSESLSRAASFRGTYGKYTGDYVSASRRSTIFDGYSGFAMYSSISQGLDEITYGNGRRSRRNSVNESNYSLSRRGSMTNLNAANSFTLPTLLATYEATKVSCESPSPRNRRRQEETQATPKQEAPKQETPKQETPKHETPVKNEEVKKVKPKLQRKVSFTEKKPEVIEANNNTVVEEPKKPQRKKEKTVVLRRKPKKQQANSSNNEQSKATRRMSQPAPPTDLFEQVSVKLQQLERERNVVSDSEEDYDGRAFSESSSSSKGVSSSECSPPQKPKVNRNSGIFASFDKPRSNRNSGIFSAFGGGGGSNGNATPDKPLSAAVRLRENVNGDSKSSSKRSSLDGKTVQGLAQDLAAECAKAYALMESSLSKLAMDFGVGAQASSASGEDGAEGNSGPFGLGPRNKVGHVPSRARMSE